MKINSHPYKIYLDEPSISEIGVVVSCTIRKNYQNSFNIWIIQNEKDLMEFIEQVNTSVLGHNFFPDFFEFKKDNSVTQSQITGILQGYLAQYRKEYVDRN